MDKDIARNRRGLEPTHIDVATQKLKEIKPPEELEIKAILTKANPSEVTPIETIPAKATALESLNLAKEILETPIKATVGQLLKDSPVYRGQVKKALVGKSRPAKNTPINVMMVEEDLGSPFVCIKLRSIPQFPVPVDGGLGVYIMMKATSIAMGLIPIPTGRTLSMANGLLVYPVGSLLAVPIFMQNLEFHINFLVMRDRNHK